LWSREETLFGELDHAAADLERICRALNESLENDEEASPRRRTRNFIGRQNARFPTQKIVFTAPTPRPSPRTKNATTIRTGQSEAEVVVISFKLDGVDTELKAMEKTAQNLEYFIKQQRERKSSGPADDLRLKKLKITWSSNSRSPASSLRQPKKAGRPCSSTA
jgi:hypothetical protein